MSARPLRFADLTLYALAIGFSLRWLPYAAAAGPASLPLWLAAMAGFMGPLVIATAELVGRFPGEAGLYGWTRETLGPFMGFLTGWLYWTCNLPFFSAVLYFMLANFAAAAGPGASRLIASPWATAGLACACAVAIGGLHLRGLGTGKWLTNFGALATAFLLATLVAVGRCVTLSAGTATRLDAASYAPPVNADGAALWSIMVFAYGGPEALAFLRDEVEGGVRQILRVLAVVAVLVTASYVAGTLAILAIMKPEEASRLAGLPDAFSLGFARLGLKAFTPVAPLLLGVSALGGYSGWFGVAARLPFAIGVDRYFPIAFAQRDRRTGAPTVAIGVQVAAVIVLVTLGQAGASVRGAYDFLVSMSVVSYTLPFVFLFLAYLSLGGAEGGGAWRAPGGAAGRRAIGLVGLLVTASAIACTLVPGSDAPDKLGTIVKLVVSSGVLIGAGAAVYAAASWRRKRRAG